MFRPSKFRNGHYYVSMWPSEARIPKLCLATSSLPQGDTCNKNKIRQSNTWLTAKVLASDTKVELGTTRFDQTEDSVFFYLAETKERPDLSPSPASKFMFGLPF